VEITLFGSRYTTPRLLAIALCSFYCLLHKMQLLLLLQPHSFPEPPVAPLALIAWRSNRSAVTGEEVVIWFSLIGRVTRLEVLFAATGNAAALP
jgi:hypothetical protein